MDLLNISRPILLPFSPISGPDGRENQGRCFSFALAVLPTVLLWTVHAFKASKQLVNVPLEGSSGIVSSYVGALNFIKNTKPILREAYKKYGRSTFKVPGLDRYTVVINKRELIDEIRKAPDNIISFHEAAAEVNFSFSLDIGENVAKNHYHAHVAQDQLTRSLSGLFDDIRDEIFQSFADLIPAKTDEWVAIPALHTMRNIICRTSNRVFVGLPLCRDPDYIDLNINFAIDVIKTIYRISWTPVLLRPFIGGLISTSSKSIRRAKKHLRPILDERFRLYEENGDDWPDKPNDMLTWLIDEAPENEKRSVLEMTKRMLVVNLAAIHTSSNSFTHALFHLAAEPQYIEPIRDEIKAVIKEEGWTKVAMTKMWKLDSFMKESQRMNGIHLHMFSPSAKAITLNRKVMTDYTLSDGTFLPAGTFVAANVTALHNDSNIYSDAEKFDGFRFVKMREESAQEGLKHQMVNTSLDYLAFGHGRHACSPGRFFAVNELKLMMAHLLLEYDLKAEVDGVRPENVYEYTRLSPNPKAKVLLKKRSRSA